MTLPQLGNMVKFFDPEISFLFLTVMTSYNDVSWVCSWTPSFGFKLIRTCWLKFVPCFDICAKIEDLGLAPPLKKRKCWSPKNWVLWILADLENIPDKCQHVYLWCSTSNKNA